LTAQRPTIRVDKWLWYARFFKTRGLASKVVTGGHVRVNSDKIAKASHAVGPDDVLTFPQGSLVRVVKVIAPGIRRGPAPEAQTLYEDMTPRQEKAPPPPKTEGKGRPTKKDRRDMRLSRDLPLE
jgi:ribosome-associated heat shock protein Hsp15